MPTIPIHIAKPPPSGASVPENPLPQLLRTPSGLAILELQGTVHFPAPTDASPSSTLVGKLVFPHYDPNADLSDTKWMKRVYFYVGENQRMAGECKKLAKPYAVIRKKESEDGDVDMEGSAAGGQGEGLEIVEVVRYKVVFSSRPEPVSSRTEEE